MPRIRKQVPAAKARHFEASRGLQGGRASAMWRLCKAATTTWWTSPHAAPKVGRTWAARSETTNASR